VGKEEDKGKTFAQWFQDEFGWTGVIIRIINGLFTFTLPGDLLADDESALELTQDDIIADREGSQLTPRTSFDDAWDLMASRIIFRVKEGDIERTLTFNETDFKDTIGQEGFYDVDERELEFNAHGVRLDSAGGDFILAARALSWLVRFFRPPQRFPLELPLSFDQLINVGDTHTVTHPQFSNADGTLGWDKKPILFNSKKQVIKPGDIKLMFQCIAYALDARVGRVSPAGRIVSCAVNGSNMDVTIAENQYTDPENPFGYPTTDAAAFTEGDFLSVVDKKGLRQSGANYERVIAVSGNVVTVSGDFGGLLTAGTGNAEQELIYAIWDECQASQQNRYAYVADSNGGLGAAPDPGWIYSEG
jgi:hypothetical protein